MCLVQTPEVMSWEYRLKPDMSMVEVYIRRTPNKLLVSLGLSQV